MGGSCGKRLAEDCVVHRTGWHFPGLQILRKITKSALRSYQTPVRGRIIPELHAQGILQYRELIVTPWRIMYRISGHTVFVLSVLDSRQNIEDILLRRLLNL